jgi:CRISPR/Cas system Type II protein with McrA/HNH and RuvC-like nuclease domain
VPRQSISKKLRFDVFKRDQFQCVYCGAHPSETVLLEIDHVHPVVEGGTNDIDNLVTSCLECNRGKGAELLTTVPQSMAEKAVMVAEREAQIKAYYEILSQKKQRKDDEIKSIMSIPVERFDLSRIDRRDLESVRRFLDHLNFFEVQEAMETACAKKYGMYGAFKYFCGICWSKIKNKTPRVAS